MNRLSIALRKNWILKKELLKNIQKMTQTLEVDTIDLTEGIDIKITDKVENVLETFNKKIEVDSNENLFRN